MLLAYYTGLPREEAPHLELSLNHVTCLRPSTYGCAVETTNLMASVKLKDDGQKHM